MPIDHPSDLPDDADRADEWRAAEDSQAPGGRRPSPPEQAAEQSLPSADGRPDDRSQASSDAPAADSERLNPGDQQGDDERRAPDTHSADEARPDASTATAEAPDPPEAATAEPRTRQEHADTPADGRGDLELPEDSIDGQTEESEQTSPNEPSDEQFQPFDTQPAPDQSPPAVPEDCTDNPANEAAQYSVEEGEPQPAEDLAPEADVGPVKPPDRSGEDDPATLTPPSDDGLGPHVEESDDDVKPDPTPINEPIEDVGAGVGNSRDHEPTAFADPATETDFPVPALTDKEWAEHVVEVRDKLEKVHSDGLATDQVYTTDPDREQWTAERNKIHGEVVRYFYDRAASVPCDHRAIIAGGLGGAGKTTVLTEQANINPAEYLTINPDNIKEELARRGLIPNIEGLSPMEAADLVHEEASAIAKQLARLAQRDGRNVIWDITMSSLESTQQRIDSLHSAGYSEVDGIFVDIPVETSVRRTQSRHREGHEKYRSGEGLGGRYVPPEVIRKQADLDWDSKNRRTFETTKKAFNNWRLYDNSIDGRRAVLLEWGSSTKPPNRIPKEELHD